MILPEEQFRPEENAWMDHALSLARKAWGETHPNPLVGAVIVGTDGKALGEGWHARAGLAHAEMVALAAAAGQNLSLATLYVTLEPCCTYGRTPPCTEAIVRSGIRRIVVGTVDPNPRHAGRGLEILRAAGCEVRCGCRRGVCEDLNLIFQHVMTTGSPLLAGKIATSLDGRIATRHGDSRWITGTAARTDVMHWRRYFPGLAVGSETVLKDNPSLTSRLPGREPWCPLRFVFDRRLRTVRELHKLTLGTDAYRQRTIIVHDETADPALVRRIGEQGLTSWQLPPDEEKFWCAFRQRCSECGCTGIYCEGGGRLLGSLLRLGQLDYLFYYQSPLLLGDDGTPSAFTGFAVESLARAPRLHQIIRQTLDDDLLTRGFLPRNNPVWPLHLDHSNNRDELFDSSTAQSSRHRAGDEQHP